MVICSCSAAKKRRLSERTRATEIHNGHENPIHMTPPGIMLERWRTSSASVEELTWRFAWLGGFYADVRSSFTCFTLTIGKWMCFRGPLAWPSGASSQFSSCSSLWNEFTWIHLYKKKKKKMQSWFQYLAVVNATSKNIIILPLLGL